MSSINNNARAADNLRHARQVKNIQKHNRQEHQKLEARKEDQAQFESTIRQHTADEFMGKQVKTRQTYNQEIAREMSPTEMKQMEELKSILNESLADGTELASLSAEEISTFREVLDPSGEKSKKFDELLEKLENASEGEEESLIDNASKKDCKNKGDIYFMLNDLFNKLGQKEGKDGLKEKLKDIIDAFHRQESAYLCEFFDLDNLAAENPQLKQKMGTLRDQMAEISSGNMRLQTLQQVIQFIDKALPQEQFHKMVSIFIKHQSKAMKRMLSLTDSPEGKEEKASIYQQQRNLIIVNTLYNELLDLISKMKKKTNVGDGKYAEFMMRTVAIIQSSTLSPQILIEMQNLIGVNK